jgi:hypothetical protein
MSTHGSLSEKRIGWLYWVIVVACVVRVVAGVAELVLYRYVVGAATILVACLVLFAAYGRRGSFRRPGQSLDEMKATTRGIPNTMRIELTAFSILVSLGGIAGLVFAVAEIGQGSVGLGFLIGVPSGFFALACGFGAVAFWLPKNRPR